MFNYQIIIEYLGTSFIGWQIQKKGFSIQSEIQKALSKVLKKKIKINGSGRTDAGVHAKAQSANFLLNQNIKDKYKFLSSVNFFLKNKQISIIKINKRNINFHARHSAKKKIYKYIILNRTTNSPMYKNRSWFLKKKLDLGMMKKAIKFFVGKHDFSSMRSTECSAKSTVRTVIKANIKKKGTK